MAQFATATAMRVSDWITMDQDRIDQFAHCTGDHQWIHVDVERAKTGPFGATIAHGFLTLSLIPMTMLMMMMMMIYSIRDMFEWK